MSDGEGQRTGSSRIFDVGCLMLDFEKGEMSGYLILDGESPAGCTARRALWPRSRKAFVKRPRSRCQKSWSGRMERSV